MGSWQAAACVLGSNKGNRCAEGSNSTTNGPKTQDQKQGFSIRD
jgi:hypothetical protein